MSADTITLQEIGFKGRNVRLPLRNYFFVPTKIASEVQIEYLSLNVCSNIVCDIPLHFINKLYNEDVSKKEDGFYHYKIFWKEIMDFEIPLFKLMDNICFRIHSGDITADTRNILYYTVRDIEEQVIRDLSKQELKQINEVNSCYEKLKKGYNEIRINFNGLVNGMFIEGINKKSVTNLQINFTNNVFIDFDDILIQLYCQDFNTDIFYIPFNAENWNIKNLYGSTDLSRIESTILRIHSEIDCDINIHAFAPNFVCIQGGRMCKALSQGTGYGYQILEGQKGPKIVPLENKICPIAYREIEAGESYMKCDKCNNTFVEECIKEWLETSNTCPICRDEWTSEEVIVNGSERP